MPFNSLSIKQAALLTIIMMCCSCGGGGGGSSASSPSPVIPLAIGTAVVDSSQVSDGVISIAFPDARGDQPRISAVTATGSNGNGLADLSHSSSSNFRISSDNIDVYFPSTGNYSLSITIEDAGDAPQQIHMNVSVPGTNSYPLSGLVQDGPLNNSVGVRSYVRLYWNPIDYPETQIAVTQSDAAHNGAYSFTNLVGPASYFRIGVDNGTH